MPGALTNMYIAYFPILKWIFEGFIEAYPLSGRLGEVLGQRAKENDIDWCMFSASLEGVLLWEREKKTARTEWDQLQLSFRDSKSAGLRAKNHRNERVWSMLWTSLSRQSNWPHIVPLFSRCGGILDNILMGKSMQSGRQIFYTNLSNFKAAALL